MDAYTSIDDALYYAAQRAAEMGATDGAEYMTAVFKSPDGTYAFLDPQGGESRGKVKATLRFPKGSVLQALVHNHPSTRTAKDRDQSAEFLSHDDIDQAKELGIPSYIVHGNDMSISGWNPGTDRTRDRRGKPFDHIPEVKPAGQYLARAVNALLGAAK